MATDHDHLFSQLHAKKPAVIRRGPCLVVPWYQSSSNRPFRDGITTSSKRSNPIIQSVFTRLILRTAFSSFQLRVAHHDFNHLSERVLQDKRDYERPLANQCRLRASSYYTLKKTLYKILLNALGIGMALSESKKLHRNGTLKPTTTVFYQCYRT